MNFLPKIRAFTILPNRILGARFSSGEVPRNILAEKEVISAHLQKENGKIYDRKPFKMTLEANKNYSWCLCGHSKTQPLCDGSHKTNYTKVKFKSVRFAVEKSGDYWICNCKQTKHRPFCDGSHKTLPEK
ncbi:CDGSH iron-sulfur domain-containing protein 3, mitochondrial [Culicoides brevitarsis]|uniref:CDGSH iron-sulfur domain-containing protein 3, mitochondrial n=1 Tax=Culicoides brevitarsis TaxID=469753 RepID=UPI00307C47B9